jgi:hypothetical protein
VTARSIVSSVALAAAFGAGCAARPASHASTSDDADLGGRFAAAVQSEQTRGGEVALKQYLDLLDRALAHPSAPRATEAWLAAVSALVERNTPNLDAVGGDQALAFRQPDAMKQIREHLRRAYDAAGESGPFARSVLARAGLRLAEHEGNAADAKLWRGRTGCARAASVLGPLEWPPITAVAHATPVEKPGEPLAATYAGIGPFSPHIAPVAVSDDDCDLNLVAGSAIDGLRAVVVDVEVPHPMTIGVVLESAQTAALVVGGKLAAWRGYELGGRRVEKWATAEVTTPGRVRVVARVGMSGDGGRIQLRFMANDGTPLASHAPHPGDAAGVGVTRAGERVLSAERASDNERALLAAAWMAVGEGRAAEHLLEQKAGQKGAGPLDALLYTRAIDQAGDLPDNRAVERARDAFETVLAAWPTSWEAVVGHAELTARRRGTSEGRLEALREIAKVAVLHPDIDPTVGALEAALGAEAGLLDVREAALQRVSRALAGTPLLAELDLQVHDRVGAEREQYMCRTEGLDRDSLACLDAKVARGDRQGALSEITRVRALRDSPAVLRPLELEQYIALGDEPGVLRVYDAMLPAERSVAALGLLLARSPAELKAHLSRDILAAADMPGALGPLSTSLLESPAAALEAKGAERIAADQKKHATASGAATLVLEHSERYAISAAGLLHYTLYDLRRVFGTTDVEGGAQAGGPLIEGRDVRRTLRRRIHKPDGRILEPDRASYASQGHADLSQLEAGDYIEQIAEGWTLPGASGQLVVDTPDLLPERTGVENASIELERPSSLPLDIWAHALWGHATNRVQGDRTTTTLVMKDRSPRRMEDGVPKMDRDVAVSFGTSNWNVIGRSIAEGIASLDDRDPFVSRWAKAAASGETNPRAIVDRVVDAVGKSVKVANGIELSDSAAAGPAGSQASSARTILELGQGSRSWLAHRALRELGLKSEIVVAETEPFSADANYPAHFGRFNEPLVLVHLASGPLWLNLDVQGPPLPAGRISPELRGRLAMNAEGQTTPVGGALPQDDRDEVDLRLTLDDKGNAAGSFTIVLRGRTAQALADALEKVVGTDRSDMLRSVVLGWVPWANVDSVELSSSEGSWQVALRAAVSIPAYAQAEGKTWVLPGLLPLHAGYPRPYSGTLGATFASQGSRESALSIERAFQYHVHRRVDLPAGMSLASAAPAVDVKNEALEAFRHAKAEPGSIDEDFGLSIPTGTVDPAKYRQFAEEAHRVDDGFQAAQRVKTNGGASSERPPVGKHQPGTTKAQPAP